MKVQTLTKTALMIALLLIVQYATRGISQQLITGSLVNLILIISGIYVGLFGGLLVAAVSPVLANLIGITHAVPVFIPFIIAANMILVFITSYTYKKFEKRNNNILISAFSGSVIVGAIAKFAFLYAAIVMLVLPLLDLPAKKIDALTTAFSFLQLFTALIGGAISIVIVPILSKALKRN